MKAKLKLFIIAGVAFLIQGLFNPLFAQEKENQDPRIQVKDNKVKIWLLNSELSQLSIKIYDERRNIITKVNLGDDLTVGKILDFNGSKNGYYRLVVFEGKEVLFQDKVKLGSS